ncbi:hatching enzyme 1.2 [Lepeophtheirus salmonis]|uniref:hatching enzyme 1.2 n=1 Tax=Lepeophtheirus salmonis TaxID=72036 RepID=UPI001AE9F241|nr:high choriolytic enzyme 1-like [Lepeophtheirus salmonis]
MRRELVALASLLILSLSNSEDILTPDMECVLVFDEYDASSITTNTFIGGRRNLWPENEVPYEISADFTTDQRKIIMDSMNYISDKTCIRFTRRRKQFNYLRIYTGDQGCFANLGHNSGRGTHIIHLQSNGCVKFGIIVHELLHILGVDHEQNRHDRDKYVQINWEHIKTEAYSNFWRSLGEKEKATSLPDCKSVGIDQYDNCHSGFRASTFDIEYDFSSIMHYGWNYFTNNGSDTISPKVKTNARVPNRSEMSILDVEKIQTAYQCGKPPVVQKKKCSDEWKWCSTFSYLCGSVKILDKLCESTCLDCPCENDVPDHSCLSLQRYCKLSFVQGYCRKTCDVC